MTHRFVSFFLRMAACSIQKLTNQNPTSHELSCTAFWPRIIISIWPQNPTIIGFFEIHENWKYRSKFGSKFIFWIWEGQKPVSPVSWPISPINRSISQVYQYRIPKIGWVILDKKITWNWSFFYFFVRYFLLIVDKSHMWHKNQNIAKKRMTSLHDIRRRRHIKIEKHSIVLHIHWA
jgi:hypothetical protein